MAGVMKVIPANRLNMMLLRVWNEFCVSLSEGIMKLYMARQNRGNTAKRMNIRFNMKLEQNCRLMSDAKMLQVDAFPYAVNGMLIGEFILGKGTLNFLYSFPSILNLSTRAAICAEDSMNRSRVRLSTVDRHK